MFKDATDAQIAFTMQQAMMASAAYKKYTLKKREALLQAVAHGLEENSIELIATAEKETHLSSTRLQNELTRTIFQLKTYGEFCASGQWMDVRIDTGSPLSEPPKPDLRKMMIPLGPVIVFGAGNFPFAYSTAGGDTACALAAGCPVIVKCHPAHAETSALVAGIVSGVVEKMQLPAGVFAHLHGAASTVGEALVKHPSTKAVGFTGSFGGGKQLFDWGNQRKTPIPVFAEMSSVNPVFILPAKMRESPANAAKMLAGSITLSVGQFCTNPGVIIAVENDDLTNFIMILKDEMGKVSPAKMLHEGIAQNYADKKAIALSQNGVQELICPSPNIFDQGMGTPTISSVTASGFIGNPQTAGRGVWPILHYCALHRDE